MANSFDRSLDDIIKTTNPSRQQNGRFPGGVRRYPTKTTFRPPQRRYIPHPAHVLGLTLDINNALTNKLNISNLHYGVNESDLESLFGEMGALRSLTLHYDRSGRSLGTADVVYERRLDAMKALKAYNGVPLDGRPMKIEFNGAGSSSRQPQQKLYVPPVRNYLGAQRGRGGGGFNRRGNFNRPFQARNGTNGSSSYSNNRTERVNKKAPTLEELDAELDEYVNNSSKSK